MKWIFEMRIELTTCYTMYHKVRMCILHVAYVSTLGVVQANICWCVWFVTAHRDWSFNPFPHHKQYRSATDRILLFVQAPGWAAVVLRRAKIKILAMWPGRNPLLRCLGLFLGQILLLSEGFTAMDFGSLGLVGNPPNNAICLGSYV